MFHNRRDSPKSLSWITPTPGFYQSVKFYLSHLPAHSDRSVGAANKGQASTGNTARVKTDRPHWAQMIWYCVFTTKLWGKDVADFTLAEFIPWWGLILQGEKIMMIILSSRLLKKHVLGIFEAEMVFLEQQKPKARRKFKGMVHI